MVSDYNVGLQPACATFLRDNVLNTLRQSIVRGMLKPGQRLNESVLARQLQTSRGPVREALVALAREGLVVLRPNRSPRVASFTGEEIKELVEVRWALETFAVRKITGKLSGEDLQRLEDLVCQMQRALAQGDRARVIEADLSLHEEIVKLAGNVRLHQIWSQLASQISLFITLAVEAGAEFGDMLKLHEELIEALRARDVERAVMTINKPNYEAGERIDQMIAKGGLPNGPRA
jgi:DNA-binding GntR family transcriptional regulator